MSIDCFSTMTFLEVYMSSVAQSGRGHAALSFFRFMEV